MRRQKGRGRDVGVVNRYIVLGFTTGLARYISRGVSFGSPPNASHIGRLST